MFSSSARFHLFPDTFSSKYRNWAACKGFYRVAPRISYNTTPNNPLRPQNYHTSPRLEIFILDELVHLLHYTLPSVLRVIRIQDILHADYHDRTHEQPRRRRPDQCVLVVWPLVAKRSHRMKGANVRHHAIERQVRVLPYELIRIRSLEQQDVDYVVKLLRNIYKFWGQYLLG